MDDVAARFEADPRTLSKHLYRVQDVVRAFIHAVRETRTSLHAVFWARELWDSGYTAPLIGCILDLYFTTVATADVWWLVRLADGMAAARCESRSRRTRFETRWHVLGIAVQQLCETMRNGRVRKITAYLECETLRPTPSVQGLVATPARRARIEFSAACSQRHAYAAAYHAAQIDNMEEQAKTTLRMYGVTKAAVLTLLRAVAWARRKRPAETCVWLAVICAKRRIHVPMAMTTDAPMYPLCRGACNVSALAPDSESGFPYIYPQDRAGARGELCRRWAIPAACRGADTPCYDDWINQLRSPVWRQRCRRFQASYKRGQWTWSSEATRDQRSRDNDDAREAFFDTYFRRGYPDEDWSVWEQGKS